MIASWGSLYANHAALRTAVEFTHIGGLLAGGGCAITADLATLTVVRAGADARRPQLQLLQRTHRLVVFGLVALFVSGALLLAADVETYWFSRVFWLKMGLIGLLLVNGALLVRGEREVRRGSDRAWERLHRTALVSLALWFATTLAGAALPNIG
ncbi:MAG TPA: hypothetical protein VHU82_07000 [Vicinamibacterales bacterium]|nr:hypothetical protein [Vicinamibacterales bacterium]